MIGSSHSIVNNKISLKSIIMDVGNLVSSSVNAQRNRQSDPMLIV